MAKKAMEESKETPKMEAMSHSKKFLSKATKLAGKSSKKFGRMK